MFVAALLSVMCVAPAVAAGEEPLGPREMLADIEALHRFVTERWSYLDDKRANFGVRLEELRAAAIEQVADADGLADFETVVRRYVAGLRDGHAYVSVPRPDRRAPRLWPIWIDEYEEGVLVRAVGEAAAALDILPGDRLVEITGEPVELAIRRESSTVYASTRGSRRRAAIHALREEYGDVERRVLTLERYGARHDVALPTVPWTLEMATDRSLPTELSWRRLGSRVGFLRVPILTADDQEAWSRARPEERDGLLADTVAAYAQAFTELEGVDGWILDLRENGGGTDLLGRALARHLLGHDFVYYSLQARHDGEWTAPFPVRDDRIVAVGFRGPLAVLIDERSFSAADNLAACLAALHPDVAFVGRPTGGGTGAPAPLPPLPHSGAVVRLCSQRVYDPSGDLIEGRGVEPDIAVRRTRDDLWYGRDPDVDAAVAWIDARLEDRDELSARWRSPGRHTRHWIVEDVIEELLIPGLPRAKVIELLGEPDGEGTAQSRGWYADTEEPGPTPWDGPHLIYRGAVPSIGPLWMTLVVGFDHQDRVTTCRVFRWE